MLTDLIFLIIFFYFGISWLKFNLYWCYVWQNYEYRTDRLRAYFSSKRFGYDLAGLFNPMEIYVIRRPKLTLKTLFILIAGFYTQSVLFFQWLKPLAVWANLTYFLIGAFTLTLAAIMIVTPFISGILAGIFTIPVILYQKYVFFKAKQKIDRLPDLITIGITGSYGKTSTKIILEKILKQKFRVVATSGSVNTAIGVAKTILTKLNPKTEIFIVEMGAYRQGEIDQICRLVKPRIGVITGINAQHLELFGTQDNILSAKYELIAALPADGLAVINTADPLSRRLYEKTKIKKIGYKKPRRSFATNLPAGFMQINIEGAVAVARHLKVSPKKILKALTKIELSKHILQIKPGINQSMVFDNSYNTNPTSFVNSLALLARKPRRKTVIITPGIIELGKMEEATHRQLAGKIKKSASILILTNKNFYSFFKKQLHGDVAVIIAKPNMNLKKIIPAKGFILMEGRIPTWLYNKIVNLK